jgi:hypothetical protein
MFALPMVSRTEPQPSKGTEIGQERLQKPSIGNIVLQEDN